jgi:hypothetical protein
MKPKNIILFGLILMLIGFITPRIVHSLSLGFGTILFLCYVVGFLMLIIGALRLSRAKKTEGDV